MIGTWEVFLEQECNVDGQKSCSYNVKVISRIDTLGSRGKQMPLDVARNGIKTVGKRRVQISSSERNIIPLVDRRKVPLIVVETAMTAVDVRDCRCDEEERWM